MQNGTKIVPRWLQDSLLEGLGPQLGPKRQLNTKKHEFWTPSRPPLEPSWGPIFIFLHQKLNYWVYFWRFFLWAVFWSSWNEKKEIFEAPGPLKTSIPSHSGANFQYFSFLVFGWYLDRFCFHFGPSWHHVGTKFGQTSRMFKKKLKKKQQQQNIKKKSSQKSWKYPQVSPSIHLKSL